MRRQEVQEDYEGQEREVQGLEEGVGRGITAHEDVVQGGRQRLAETARLLHKDKGTISRRLHNEGPPQKQGAKCILTPAQVDHLIGKTKAYVKQGTSF